MGGGPRRRRARSDNRDASRLAFVSQPPSFSNPETLAVTARSEPRLIPGLAKFMDYARKNGPRLYFVIWPFAAHLDDDAIPREVMAALRDRGADFIDVTPVLRNRPFSEITVSSSG